MPHFLRDRKEGDVPHLKLWLHFLCHAPRNKRKVMHTIYDSPGQDLFEVINLPKRVNPPQNNLHDSYEHNEICKFIRVHWVDVNLDLDQRV